MSDFVMTENELKIKNICHILEDYGCKLIGSRYMNLHNDSSDYDYLMLIDENTLDKYEEKIMQLISLGFIRVASDTDIYYVDSLVDFYRLQIGNMKVEVQITTNKDTFSAIYATFTELKEMAQSPTNVIHTLVKPYRKLIYLFLLSNKLTIDMRELMIDNQHIVYKQLESALYPIEPEIEF